MVPFLCVVLGHLCCFGLEVEKPGGGSAGAGRPGGPGVCTATPVNPTWAPETCPLAPPYLRCRCQQAPRCGDTTLALCFISGGGGLAEVAPSLEGDAIAPSDTGGTSVAHLARELSASLDHVRQRAHRPSIRTMSVDEELAELFPPLFALGGRHVRGGRRLAATAGIAIDTAAWSAGTPRHVIAARWDDPLAANT